MSRRQTWSQPCAAEEASNAVFLFLSFAGFPRELSYTVSQRLAYPPHLALQWGVNTLALMHSLFSLVFHLCFVMLGEISLWAFLRTAVKRIGMFPHRFVMRCDGVPLSCCANPILVESWDKYEEVCYVLVRVGFVTSSLAGICESAQRLNCECTEAAK